MTTAEPPSQKLYIPPNALTLAESPPPQQRIGIQGFPGTGKTFGSLGWPNCIVANIDKGLGAHHGRSDVIELPFWNPDYLRKINNGSPNLKTAILQFVVTEARKFTENQTFVIDALRGIDAAYHTDWRENPKYASGGKIDDFKEWGLKLIYFSELCEALNVLKCNVILITHESEKKDKDGTYSGKIRPMLQGSFADKIVSHFTDWFRQHAIDKPKSPDLIKEDEIKANWGMTKAEFIAMCNTFPRQTIYAWQTESDNVFDGKCSSLVNFPRYIPAKYEYFCKYLRKVN